MPDFKMGNPAKTVISQSGTANPTWGANAPTGAVVNVLSTSKTDTQTLSANSWADISNLSVSITPKSTSNKILIFGVVYIGQDSGGDVMTRIVRDSTAIGIGDASSSRQRATTGGSPRQVYEMQSHPFNFLDSPSTTSSTTYKIQYYCGDVAYVNRTENDADNANAERTISTITVMEIAG